jgi:ribosome biogenesis protein NSA2
VHGLRAKLYNQKRFKEKAAMRKTIAEHNERGNKHANDDAVADGAVPAYLLDREGVSRAKVLSNTVKQKRKEKAGKWDVPIPKVKPVADDEMFKVLKSGKTQNKAWKRMVSRDPGCCCGACPRCLSTPLTLFPPPSPSPSPLPPPSPARRSPR